MSVNFRNFGKCQTACQSIDVSLTAHCECVVSLVNGMTNQLGGFSCAHSKRIRNALRGFGVWQLSLIVYLLRSINCHF